MPERSSAMEALGVELRLTAQDVRARTQQLRAQLADRLARAEAELRRLQRSLAAGRTPDPGPRTAGRAVPGTLGAPATRGS